MAEHFTLPKPTDRAEWLAVRHRDPDGRKWANASDAGTLMAANPHESLADLAVRWLAPEPPDDDPTEAMERGNRLEPALLAWYGDQHGVHVVTPDVLHGFGRLLATLDGVPTGVDDVWVEAKTTAEHWQSAPEHVFWQVVGQSICTGRTACDVVWIDASMRFKSERLVPTDSDRDALLRRVDEVLAFIDMGLVPEGAHLHAKHIHSLHPTATPGVSVELTPVEFAAVRDWNEARAVRLADEKLEDAAKARVLAVMLDAEEARYQGQQVATWRNNAPSERVDWKALEADHPDLVDQYRKVVPGARVLRPTTGLGHMLDTPEGVVA